MSKADTASLWNRRTTSVLVALVGWHQSCGMNNHNGPAVDIYVFGIVMWAFNSVCLGEPNQMEIRDAVKAGINHVSVDTARGAPMEYLTMNRCGSQF